MGGRCGLAAQLMTCSQAQSSGLLASLAKTVTFWDGAEEPLRFFQIFN